MKTIQIEGERESATLTDEEYAAWVTYADGHEHLLNGCGYMRTLEMFLFNLRRVGVNPNQTRKPDSASVRGGA